MVNVCFLSITVIRSGRSTWSYCECGADLEARGGKLWLQDHGQDVWFRNLLLRPIGKEEILTADPNFKPLPVTGEALQKRKSECER